MITENDEQPVAWVIRFTERANANLEAGWEHFAQTAGEEIADIWREGLENEIAKLSRMPERLPIASENHRFTATVRSLLYRRTPRGPAYRVLFILRLPAEESPTVEIINIRHAAQRPITKKEAREMESGE